VPVLIWIARAVLAASALLTVVFDPRLFFGKGGGSGNWISFGSWFYDGSWWAFRLAVTALVLYGITAVTAEADARVGWRGPVFAVVLLLWGLVRGIPHQENNSRWSQGAVGALAWIRAERDQRDRAPRVIDATMFTGLWRSADGSAWRFGPNDAARVADSLAGSPRGSSRVPSPAAKRAACSGPYRVGYKERGRDVLVESGLDASAHGAEIWHAMPERVRLPVASVGCSEEAWAGEFVLVRPDELWLLEPWMTAAEVRADAFVFRRETGK
jgi:hypothetical protein